MKAKKNLIVTIILFAIILSVVQVAHVVGKSEQSTETTPQPKYIFKQADVLAGLQGVRVFVEGFRPDAEKYGLTSEQFKTDVELRLRQYGVKILSLEESAEVIGWPNLKINVNPLINEKMGAAAVGIIVELKEMVLLQRNPMLITQAVIWSKKTVLHCSLNKLVVIRNDVRDLVDEFINDYLAANPKVQPIRTKNE